MKVALVQVERLTRLKMDKANRHFLHLKGSITHTLKLVNKTPKKWGWWGQGAAAKSDNMAKL